MKNHLSMLGSIGAGARFSFGRMLGSWSGLTRLGECLTVILVLLISQYRSIYSGEKRTYIEISPGLVLPVINFSQASAHSRTISDAYLDNHELINNTKITAYLLLIFALASECELVFRLSVWDLIDSEPFICSSQ
jgi:predicted membrane protein